MPKMKRNLSRVAELVAKDLRAFGYPDATEQMVVDVWRDMQAGKTGHDLPHGVIGLFVESQINEAVRYGLAVVDDVEEGK